jgi:hypothetical protein
LRQQDLSGYESSQSMTRRIHTTTFKARILTGIDEMNQVPVAFRWKKFDIGIA